MSRCTFETFVKDPSCQCDEFPTAGQNKRIMSCHYIAKILLNVTLKTKKKGYDLVLLLSISVMKKEYL